MNKEQTHNEIISYPELCVLAGGLVQKGINVKYKGRETILLMSQRVNAPYPDKYDPVEKQLFYVGHDAKKTQAMLNPKDVDQPLLTDKGRPSDNAKLIDLVKKHKKGESAEKVHIFEKIQAGIWFDKGHFLLEDYEEQFDGRRKIFVFMLKQIPAQKQEILNSDFEHTRMIPIEVKIKVWKRDKGACVQCSSNKNLHYDHDIPFSKGGSSITADNIRILCATCNLKKGAKIA